MFTKKKCVQDRKILCELFGFMEQKTLNWETASQVLEKLQILLGGEVDCFITVLVKGREEFLFTTLPEDEALYYKNMNTEREEYRVSGKKAYQIRMETGRILEGMWVYEVPERTSTEEISAYLRIASELKYFLYSCILAQECERQEKTDCFTGLPACRLFEENLHDKLSRKEQGFLIAIRSSVELPKPYREDGINFFLIKTAEICAAVHPDGLYRIGPNILAVLCREKKEETFSILQELMQKLPESTFSLIPLSGLSTDSIYARIQRGIDTMDRKEFISGEDEIFPCLPVFQEGT